MSIYSIDSISTQSQLSAVQHRKEEEEKEVKKSNAEKAIPSKVMEESEVLSVDPKGSSSSIAGFQEDANVNKSKSKGSHSLKDKSQVLRESYLGKNIDLKG